ncbi:MAG: hypothetical protein MJY79_07240 [Bacteroidaceae bacterium]|nr:hypothetical protein [Bacteroidaceae bacterium]
MSEFKKNARILQMCLLAIYLTAGITALLYETGFLQIGTVTDEKTIYLMQVAAVLLSLGLIPISLRGFKGAMDRMSEKPLEKRMTFYMVCSYLRQTAYLIVIEFSVLLYYLINDDIGLYCALIGFICSLFCYPTAAGIEHEIGE